MRFVVFISYFVVFTWLSVQVLEPEFFEALVERSKSSEGLGDMEASLADLVQVFFLPVAFRCVC